MAGAQQVLQGGREDQIIMERYKADSQDRDYAAQRKRYAMNINPEA